MKRLIFFRFIVLASLGIPLFGCNSHEDRLILSLKDLEQHKPFTVTVDVIRIDDAKGSLIPAIIGLKTESGERVSLAGPTYGADLRGFAATLQKGKAYEFPKQWLVYKERVENEPRK